MSQSITQPEALRFDLAAEAISVRIRWFGVCVGFGLVNLVDSTVGSGRDVPVLNAILGFSVLYVVIDSLWSWRGKVFLSDWPLAVSMLEAVFIGLLCYFDTGQASAFRFYYFLSVVVCAIRYSPKITYITFLFHALSFSTLLLSEPRSTVYQWMVMVVSIGWVTWASTHMARLIQIARERLTQVNEQLEQRIADRTQELNESQAMLVQHEKQAAFGLLAAGIAHEVGNPLAAISSLVQILKRRSNDDDTHERYVMIGDQLRRIQGILRELVDFSRPTTTQPTLSDIHEVLESSLNIAKYYKRRKGKRIVTRYASSLPPMRLVRDQLVQVFLNLILNAMDATPEGRTIEISTSLKDGWVEVLIRDEGHGIDPNNTDEIFAPYFTTKPTGTGLGLFVCRQILESCGGKIELCETSHTGTTFSVSVTSKEVAKLGDVESPVEANSHVLSSLLDSNLDGE